MAFIRNKQVDELPAAYKELEQDGNWSIYFLPNQKMSGVNYSCVKGFIDEDVAETLVTFWKTQGTSRQYHDRKQHGH